MTIKEAENEKLKAQYEIMEILTNLQNKTGLFIDSATFHRVSSGAIYLEIKICL